MFLAASGLAQIHNRCAVALVVVFSVLAGCGGDDGSSSSAKPSATANAEHMVTTFTAAFADRDFRKACQLLSSKGRDALLQYEYDEISGEAVQPGTLAADECAEEAAAEVFAPVVAAADEARSAKVVDTDITNGGERAVVETDSGSWTLSEQNGGWVIDDAPILDPVS